MGIEEMPHAFRAWFSEEVPLECLQPLQDRFRLTVNPPLVSPIVSPESAEPFLIGKRFVLVPTDRIVLPIDAAMAFGTGRHETTQLCLQALEEIVKPGDVVFDIGCGSGILALAALRLGAGRVVATDIDEASLHVARRHFPGSLVAGSADCLATASADVVLSNITGAVNDGIASDLKRVTKPNGVIIVSGFLTSNPPRSFRPKREIVMGEWSCWITKRESVHVSNAFRVAYSHNANWWT